jgi:cell surface protein SprA
MFIHAEPLINSRGVTQPLKDNDVTAFIRLGADFIENYYEYEIPLKLTPYANYNPTNDNDRRAIWPLENELNVTIDSLTLVKQLRNNQKAPLTQEFSITDAQGRRISVRGNPDLGQAAVAMLGIRNPRKIIGVNDSIDDGQSKCAEVWFNELRMGGFDEQGGYAALGRMDMQLGGLGNMTVSGSIRTIGFGDLEQRLNERSRENTYTYDVAANIDVGKLLPQKAGIEIPVFAGYSASISTPQYDPYEFDIEVKDKLNTIDADPTLTPQEKKELKEELKDKVQTVSSIKSVNVSNMRKLRTNPEKPARVYDVENFDLTYAYTEVERSNPILEEDVLKTHKFAIGYNYAPKTNYWQPFKGIKNNHRYLKPVKEVNFNFKPNTISVRSDINRQIGQSIVRDIGNDGLVIPPTYNKFFTWDRYYNYKHNLTKNLNFDFVATNRARIDEPFGLIDTRPKRDSLMRNFWNFGRNVGYDHLFNVNYTLPFQFIPALDFMTVRGRYNANFRWTAAPLSIPEWGNILSLIHI